jgi:hypothetical protein
MYEFMYLDCLELPTKLLLPRYDEESSVVSVSCRLISAIQVCRIRSSVITIIFIYITCCLFNDGIIV